MKLLATQRKTKDLCGQAKSAGRVQKKHAWALRIGKASRKRLALEAMAMKS